MAKNHENREDAAAYNPVNYWNARAEAKGIEWDSSKLDNLVNWYLSYFGTNHAAAVLDIGCAWGRALRRFKQRNIAINMTMCDISEVYLELCRKEHGVKPDLWDGETLPYDDKSFDLVISNSLLLHVPFGMIQRVWDEQVRVSRRFIFIGSSYKSIGELDFHCFQHDYEALIKGSTLEILEEFFYSVKVNWWLGKVP